MLATLALDGSGRLLDIGCGPGSIGLMPAPHYAEVVGVDADADMIAEATRLKRPWFTTRHGAIYEPRTAPPASANFARAVFPSPSTGWIGTESPDRSTTCSTPTAPSCTSTPPHRGGDDTKGLAGPQPHMQISHGW